MYFYTYSYTVKNIQALLSCKITHLNGLHFTLVHKTFLCALSVFHKFAFQLEKLIDTLFSFFFCQHFLHLNLRDLPEIKKEEKKWKRK